MTEDHDTTGRLNEVPGPAPELIDLTTGETGLIAVVFRDCPECGSAIGCRPEGDRPTGCKDHS